MARRLQTVFLGIALLAAVSALPSGAAGCNCRSSASTPAWSPDGTSILYMSATGDAAFVSEAPVTGAEPTVLTRLRGFGTLTPVFSPNGQRLASATSKPPGIWISDPSAKDGRQVSAESAAASSRSQRLSWLPDSRRLVFAAADGTIRLLDVDTGEQRTLATGTFPLVSPDGTTVAFERSRRVWLVRSNGTGERQLTFDDAEAPAAKQKFIDDRIGTWSPNSRWLAYSRQVDSPYEHYPTNAHAWNVLVADVATGQISKLSDNGRDPAWSPDGTRLAYASAGIAIVNADGSDRRLLTDHAYTDSHPVWSPDGRSIAFSGTAGYGTELFLIRSEGGDLHNLTGPCTVSPALTFGFMCTDQGGTSVPVGHAQGDYRVSVFRRSGLKQIRTDPCHCFSLSVVVHDADGNRIRGAHVRATAGAVRLRYGAPATSTYGTARLYLTTTTALRKAPMRFFAVRIEARDGHGKVRGSHVVRLPLPRR